MSTTACRSLLETQHLFNSFLISFSLCLPLQILQTLPFDKIKIDIISIHLLEDQEDVRDYVQSITKFLAGKYYKLQRKIGRNYFYQRLNAAASRTRKKDILLLKTPQQ